MMVGMSEFDDLLDEAMGAFDEEPEDVAALDVAGVDRYAWALRSVASKIEALDASYLERRGLLDTVHETERTKLMASYTRLEHLLQQWMLAWNMGDEKKKSHTLPSGVKVATTAGSIDMSITDNDAFEAWVKKNMPEAVETVEKVKKGEVKKAVIEGSTEATKHDGKKIKTGGVAITGDGAKVDGVELVKKPRTAKVTL